MTRPVRLSLPGPVPSGKVNIIDWNADGMPDLLDSFNEGGGHPSKSTWDKKTCGTSSPYTNQSVWRGYEGRGLVHLYRNTGTKGAPAFTAEPETLRTAAGDVVDVPSGGNPCIANLDGDGDADLLIGNRFDLYWFENIGTETQPELARGYPLPLKLIDIYIRPVTADFDGDGDLDVIFGNEGGDVRWLENTGRRDAKNLPILSKTRIVQQVDPLIDSGSVGAMDLADLNGDGRPDVILGNSYGEVYACLSDKTGLPWSIDAAVRVKSSEKDIHVFAGASGSIQGPEEAHYGYVAPEIADWNCDGMLDLMLHDVWGLHRFYPGITKPGPGGEHFGPEKIVKHADPADARKPDWTWWNPDEGELATAWRCRPELIDLDGDGTLDLVNVDHEGFLACYKGIKTADGMRVGPGGRIFIDDATGKPLMMNDGCHGRSGRRKLNLVDWDGDGDLDLIRNMAGPALDRTKHPEEFGHAAYFENVGEWRFRDHGEMVPLKPVLAGHGTCPIATDFDGDGILDLFVGSECGHIFAYHRAFLENDLPKVSVGWRVRIRK